MTKLNVALISGLLAVAAVLGTVAATRTVSLGAARRPSGAATVRARTLQLDRFQASLERALANKPPALPAVPSLPAPPPPAAATLAAATSPTTAAPAPQIVYRRPPPIVIVKHNAHADDGAAENEGNDG
ncbi:MAG: hypothetical protein ACYDCH_14610 [Gaiellaceae bacterium]